eukprot:gene6204-biopygen5245
MMVAVQMLLVSLHAAATAAVVDDGHEALPAVYQIGLLDTDEPHLHDGRFTRAVVYSADGSSAVRLKLDLGLPPDAVPRIDPAPGGLVLRGVAGDVSVLGSGNATVSADVPRPPPRQVCPWLAPNAYPAATRGIMPRPAPGTVGQ